MNGNDFPYQEVWFGPTDESLRFMKVLTRDEVDLLEMLRAYGWLTCQIDYGKPLKYLTVAPLPKNFHEAV